MGLGDGGSEPNLLGFLTCLPDLVVCAPLAEASPCWEEIAKAVVGLGVPFLAPLPLTSPVDQEKSG